MRAHIHSIKMLPSQGMSADFSTILSLVNSAIHLRPIAPEIKYLDFRAVIYCARRQGVDSLLADIPLKSHVRSEDLPVFSQWLSSIVQLEMSHMTTDAEIVRITSAFAAAGVRYALIKGQCSAANYPHPIHRHIGDIDIYVVPQDYERARALMTDLKYVYKSESKAHTNYFCGKYDLELHKCLQHLNFPLTNRRLRRYMERHFDNANIALPTMQMLGQQVCILPPEIEILLHTLHIRKHLISSGIGLRHIYDWAMCWERYKCEVDWPQLHRILEETHAMRTFRIIFYFAITHLDFPWSEKMLGGSPLTSLERGFAARLWRRIEATGNFNKDVNYGHGLRAFFGMYGTYLKRFVATCGLSHTEVLFTFIADLRKLFSGRVKFSNTKKFLRESVIGRVWRGLA